MKQDSLMTGWNTLDHLTGGFGRGELTIIAGRPGVGKTSFAMEITRRLSVESARRIVVFALDITRENFAQRLLSQISGVNVQSMKATAIGEEQWDKLQKAAALIGKTGIFIDDTPALTPRAISERCWKLTNQEGQIDLVIVDYLQLLRSDEANSGARDRELADISRSLKHVAKELKCAILLVCQLERAQIRPTLLTVREMAPIESNADTLLLFHRDSDPKAMECIVGKARNGSNGLVRLECELTEIGLVFGGDRVSL